MTGFAVSVVIPLYNKQAYIRQTLHSALDQSRRAAEIIVVDDQSTDDSVAAIADLVGGRVRLVAQPNAGPGVARNRGIEVATNEWIAFLDADDLWQPNHLATLAEVAAACPDAQVVAASHRRLAANLPPPPLDSSPLHAKRIDSFVGVSETLCSSSVAVRRSALLAVGGFDAGFPGEDIDLWLRLALDNEVAATARVTSVYFQNTGGVMDSLGEPRAGGGQPIVDTIARALADPRHAARHAALRGLRDRYLGNTIKQELYRGEHRAARARIAECDRLGIAVPLGYRLLARLPAPAVAAGIRAKAALRR